MAKEKNAVDSLLTTVRNVITTYKGTAGDGISLADVTKIARVEPITLVSNSLSSNSELHDILHGVLDIYASYYLQAVSILSTELTDVRILKILDKVNPDRDMRTLLTAGVGSFESYKEPTDSEKYINNKTMSLENSKYKLPMLSQMKDLSKLGMEYYLDADANAEAGALNTSITKLENFEKVGQAVGKVMQVTFKVPGDGKEGGEVTIPVVVKLDTMVMPGEVISRIVSNTAEEIRFGTRFKQALAGRIGFIKDFLLCSDLVKSQKRAMIKDPTGYYSELVRRVNKSKVYSLLSGNISMSGVSSIYVISEDEEEQIQRHIGGKLTNKNTRDIVFDNTSAMMIVVVSTEWERVSIYIRDIDGFSQNSFRDFKRLSDKGGDNITEILKAFQLNTPPAF